VGPPSTALVTLEASTIYETFLSHLILSLSLSLWIKISQAPFLILPPCGLADGHRPHSDSTRQWPTHLLPIKRKVELPCFSHLAQFYTMVMGL
jgi:hypothetical protein